MVQLLHYEFPYILYEDIFSFLFNQCICTEKKLTWVDWAGRLYSCWSGRLRSGSQPKFSLPVLDLRPGLTVSEMGMRSSRVVSASDCQQKQSGIWGAAGEAACWIRYLNILSSQKREGSRGVPIDSSRLCTQSPVFFICTERDTLLL